MLLGLGCLSLITSYYFIPSKEGNPQVALSLKSYFPLLQSKILMSHIAGFSLLNSAYWVFITMAPFYYIKSMGVTLDQFGYYQGSLCLSYALICVMIPHLLRWFGPKKCFYKGIIICFISAWLILAMAFFDVHQPLVITGVLIVFSVALVFPINVLSPR